MLPSSQPAPPPPNAARVVAQAFARGLLWTVLATLCLIVAFGMLKGVAPKAVENLSVAALVEAVVYGAFAVLLVLREPRPGARVRALGFVRPAERALLLAALLGVTIHGPADLLELLMQWLAPLPDSVIEERARRLAPPGALERAGVMATVAVIVPLVEEMFFRGALYSRLAADAARVPALIATGACFVVAHAEYRLWPALAVVAFALSALRARSAGIWPCFLLHGCFNATTLCVAFVRGPELDLHVPLTAAAIAFSAFMSAVSVAVLIALFRPAPAAERELS